MVATITFQKAWFELAAWLRSNHESSVLAAMTTILAVAQQNYETERASLTKENAR